MKQIILSIGFLFSFVQAAYAYKCDFYFTTVPHQDGRSVIPEQTIKKIWEKYDYSQKSNIINETTDLAEKIVQETYKKANIDAKIEKKIVAGGWGGNKYPSLIMTVEAVESEETSRDIFAQAAATLGYVFLQQSIMVDCAGFPESKARSEIRATSTAEDRYKLDLPGAIALYDLYIGENKTSDGTGFTYLPLEYAYVLIIFDNEDEILEKTVTNFNKIHDKKILKVSTDANKYNIAFVSNDWNKNPLGQGYEEKIKVWGDTREAKLSEYRKLHKKAIKKATAN